jgi:hypothetical protein
MSYACDVPLIPHRHLRGPFCRSLVNAPSSPSQISTGRPGGTKTHQTNRVLPAHLSLDSDQRNAIQGGFPTQASKVLWPCPRAATLCFHRCSRPTLRQAAPVLMAGTIYLSFFCAATLSSLSSVDGPLPTGPAQVDSSCGYDSCSSVHHLPVGEIALAKTVGLVALALPQRAMAVAVRGVAHESSDEQLDRSIPRWAWSL